MFASKYGGLLSDGVAVCSVYFAYKVVRFESTCVDELTKLSNVLSLYHPSNVNPVLVGVASVPICCPIVPFMYWSARYPPFGLYSIIW